MVEIKRGDIFWADLEPVRGSEQGGIRPVLIIQNDTFNIHSPTTIIAPLTSKKPSDSKLRKDSTVLLNQIRTIDKIRLTKKISSLDSYIILKINKALKMSLSLD